MSYQKPKYQLLVFAALAAVLLAALFPLPFRVVMTGHPWKVELLVAIALLLGSFFLHRKKVEISFLPELKTITTVLGAFVVLSASSALWAVSWVSVFHHTFLWFCYLFVILFTANWMRSRSGLAKFLEFLVFLGVLLSSLTIVAYLFLLLSPDYEAVFRVAYSKYSEILVALVPFYFGLAITTTKKTSRIHSFSAVLSFAAIVVSLSRTSFIAVLVGLALVTVLGFAITRRRVSFAHAGVLVLAFLLVLSITQLISSKQGQENTLYGRFSSTSSYQTSSGDIRLLLLGVSKEMIVDNPVLGVGADNYGVLLNKYRAKFGKSAPSNRTLRAGQELMLERTHNEFIQIFSELGILGGLTIISLFVFGLLSFIRQLRLSSRCTENIIRISAFSGAVAFLVSSVASSFSFRVFQNGIVFFVLFAIAVAPYGSIKRTMNRSATKTLLIISSVLSVASVLIFASQAASGYYTARGTTTEDFEQAIKLFETAQGLDSNNAAADMSLGIRYFNEKEPLKAVPLIKAAIDKSGGVISTYYFLAVSYELAGDLESAIGTARKCRDIYPHSPFARIYLAELLKKSGDNKSAEREVEFALRIDRKNAETWRLIYKESALKVSIRSRTDSSITPLADLTPNSVVQALVAKEKLYE
ncbi:MAG: hypothetical protein HKN33_05570 [Pyrinomonadaceae bacterium]|nr:hypothetical protein [Pyrinomonadaceae bacterium]